MLVRKKFYEEPEFEVIIFPSADVLGLSDGNNTGGLDDGGGENEGWEFD